MKLTKITFDTSGLDAMVKTLKGSYARVGVLGEYAPRSEHSTGESLNNAELLVIQMFGSVSRNIPPRDPLITPIANHGREIVKAVTSPSAQNAFTRGNYEKVFKLLGAAGEAVVQGGFETGGYGMWPDIKQSTKDQKGSSSILIDTGELRRSITSDAVMDART